MLIRIVLSILVLSTSSNENDDPVVIIKPDLIFYGLTATNQVIQYNANAPEYPISTLTVTGLQSGEMLIASTSGLQRVNYTELAARAGYMQ